MALVPLYAVLAIWDDVEQMVAKALLPAGGRILAEDVLQLALAQRMQIWISAKGRKVDAVAVTEVIAYPRLKAVRFVVLAGDAPSAEWLGYEDTILDWAKAEGCSLAEGIMARPGWERLMRGTGWRRQTAVVEKEI